MLADGANVVHLRAKSVLAQLHVDSAANYANASLNASHAELAAGRHNMLQAAHKLTSGVLAVAGPESEARRPVIDIFLVVYWGAVVGLVLFIIYIVQPMVFGQDEEESDEGRSARESVRVFNAMDVNQDGMVSKEEFLEGGSELLREEERKEEDSDYLRPEDRRSSVMGPKEVHLPHTMWSLNIVAAIGQAQVREKELSGHLIAILTLGMAFLQMFALFLVVHDINPDVDPVTVQPSSPWIHTGWSVNCMKWLMVCFMSMLMVTEAGECRTILTCILETNSHRLREPRWMLMFVCFFQYIIMVFVIWGGVAAVLSFQSVPDILYSSMSITYIAKVDEAFFTMLYQIFEFEADFVVVHGRKVSKMDSESLFAALDADGDGNITKDEFNEFQDQQLAKMLDSKLRPEELSPLTEMALHFLAAFPCLLGFALIGRAFYTNVMPTDRFHDLKAAVMDLLIPRRRKLL